MRPTARLWQGLAAAVLLTLPSAIFPALADDLPQGHFRYSGPMSQFMPEGKTPAAVSSGLPFTVDLTENGNTISPAQFDLKIPTTTGPVALKLDNLKFAAGHLTADVKLNNGSGSPVEGLRLDITSAREEYKAKDDKGEYLKDDKGQQILKSRAQTVSIPSPLFFGDLSKNDDSDALPLDVSALTFGPDTTRLSVSGVLSGMLFMGTFGVPDVANPAGIDVDSKGRVYLADVVGQRVVRTTADGKDPNTVAKLPDQQCLGVAVDPKSGEVYATCGNMASTVFKYTPGGDDDGKIDEKSGLDNYVPLLRCDNKGNLYAAADGGSIYRLKDSKVNLHLEKAGDYDVLAKFYDVAADGSFFICSDNSLLKVDGAGQNGRRLTSGPDWHVGRVTDPVSCRIDSAGNVYVLEAGNDQNETYEAPRISVFDKDGKIIRVFGRGAKTRTDPAPDGMVEQPVDAAFGKDGRLYAATKSGGDKTVMMFQPF